MARRKAQVIDEGALHKYRTEIPNTVVRGNMGRGLSLPARWLYVYLKSVAGDVGECWQSSHTMAKGAQIALGTVSKAKTELVQRRLIAITQGNQGKHEPDRVRILDIWRRNMEEFSVSPGETVDGFAYPVKPGDSEARFHQMKADGLTVSPDEGAVSPDETKKIPVRITHEEYTPPVSPLGETSPPKEKSRNSGKTSLPSDFSITDDMRAWGQRTFPHIDLDATTDQWLDACRAKDYRYKDWVSAWRNGMRKAVEWKTAVMKPFRFDDEEDEA